MSHDLETRDGKTSFAYVAKNGDPWHSLGTPIESYMTIDEALTVSRTDFTVEKRPLFAQADLTNYRGEPIMLGVPGKVATVRDIPGRSGEYQVLGVVGENYEVVQNRTVIERAYDVVGAADGDAYLDTAGALFQGQRVFYYIRLDDLVIDPIGINDRIERGLALYSSHDGTIAVTYAFTDIRAVCRNTITMGVNGASRIFRAKHTNSVDLRMQEADKILGVSADWAKAFRAKAEQLLAVPMPTERREKILEKVFPEPKGATERQKANVADKRTTVRGLYAGPTNSANYGENGWTMYNAIVEYLDHYRKGVSHEDRQTSIMEPRDNSWVNTQKIRAAELVLASA